MAVVLAVLPVIAAVLWALVRMHDYRLGWLASDQNHQQRIDSIIDGTVAMTPPTPDPWMMDIVLHSTLTCPHCGAQSAQIMPTDACLFFFDCPACGQLLRPKAGDCCVFCSYGTVPCPPRQQDGACCG